MSVSKLIGGVPAVIGLLGGDTGYDAAGKAQERLYKDEVRDVERMTAAIEADIERKYGRSREVQAVENSIAGIDAHSGSMLAGQKRDQAEVERDRLYSQGNAAAQRRRLVYQGSAARAQGKNQAAAAKVQGFYTAAQAAMSAYATFGRSGETPVPREE